MKLNTLFDTFKKGHGRDMALLETFMSSLLNSEDHGILPWDGKEVDHDKIDKNVEAIIIQLLERNFCIADIYIILIFAYSHFVERRFITELIYKHKDFKFQGKEIERQTASDILSKLKTGKPDIISDEAYGEESACHGRTAQAVSVIGTYTIAEAVEKFGGYILSGKIIERKAAWDDNWSDYYTDDGTPFWTEIKMLEQDRMTQNNKTRDWWGVLLILYLRRISKNQVTAYQFLEINI